jgi:hypothetical protein
MRKFESWIRSVGSMFSPVSRPAPPAVLALHILDPIVRNTYRSNAVVLGEWTIASHVESAPKKTKKTAPPPAPNS